MKNYFYACLLMATYAAGYCDYLQPGFLKFALPAAWNQPLSTSTTYDLAAGVRDTAKCTALEAVPDWAKPADWFRDRSKEPQTCKQRLKEAEEK